MAEPFALEWLGGVAEHHYRRARPAPGDIDWNALQAAQFRPEVCLAGRRVWTDVTMSEYAAVVQFSQVVSALAEARAPLDLLGMVSDFITDEVKHVELAARLVMQLGGAARRAFDPRRLALPLAPSLTPFQRANELALRIGCIGEAYAGGTAAVMMKATGHPVVRAVYETILRDEARHVRFGSLYFSWAGALMDDAERTRLAAVALATLKHYARLWNRPPPANDTLRLADDEARMLGWFTRADYGRLAVTTVQEDILPTLRALDLPLDESAIDDLLRAPGRAA